mmetsp:Transcript_11207/g.20295  ORF Transcript_11207/g.20295 Transcript_11207/m.20295 type:complete len:310 (-) Transcript_11207:820-1749(-)
MQRFNEAEFVKVLSSAIQAAKLAEDGDTSEEGRCLDALKLLLKTQVSTELLKNTDSGRKVKKLSKSTCSSIEKLSIKVIDAWKECIKKESATKDEKVSEKANEAKQIIQKCESEMKLNTKTVQAPEVRDSPDLYGLPKPEGPLKTGNEIRDKARQLFREALSLAIGEGVTGDPEIAAVLIEEAMYRFFGSVNNEYKAKARSLNFNLRDAKNPALRGRVLLGEISSDELVTSKPEDLASEELRKRRQDLKDVLAKNAVRGDVNLAVTDIFQCSKCKQRKCSYFQLQTRSADEPMTTFVTCVNCGNKWRFS